MYISFQTRYLILAEGYKKVYQGGIAQAIQFAEWLEKIGYKNVTIGGKTPKEWRENQ